jgi:hypothetical protein
MPWLKLHTDILGDLKLKRAVRGGLRELELLPWLMAFAKHADDDGRLTVGGAPATPEEIAELLPGVKPKRVATCIASAEAIGILAPDFDGAMRFVNFARRQGHPSDSREEVAKRVARYRDKRKASGNDGNPVTVTTKTPRYGNDHKRREEENRGDEMAASSRNDHPSSAWTEDQREAASAIRRTAQSPRAFDAIVKQVADGGPQGAGFGWPIVGQAMLEMQGTSPRPPFSLVVLLAYCRRIRERPRVRPKIELVTDHLSREVPAIRQPDGSWKYLTDDEARALGWTGAA